ncbi:MAG TPA: hypothetical protein VNU97_18585 [Rhizomicrobium sp.]|nr:hypothetical protein [Rhizomicrobium sp.]
MIRSKSLALGAVLAVMPVAAQAAATAAAMSAMQAAGGMGGKPIVLPRLVKFPDTKVMAKVNAAIAVQEKQDRDGIADCLSNLKDSGRKPSDGSYDITVKVTYLSAHYLSLTDVNSYDCAGAHPDFNQTVLSFDLDTGAPLDIMATFRPDFVSAGLGKLYAARYRMPKTKDDDADCRGWASDPNSLTELEPRLDASVGIVIAVATAHVVAACADDLPLSLADLARVLKDQKLLADLKANVKPAHK